MPFNPRLNRVGQFYKASMIVNYNASVVLTRKLPIL